MKGLPDIFPPRYIRVTWRAGRQGAGHLLNVTDVYRKLWRRLRVRRHSSLADWRRVGGEWNIAQRSSWGASVEPNSHRTETVQNRRVNLIILDSFSTASGSVGLYRDTRHRTGSVKTSRNVQSSFFLQDYIFFLKKKTLTVIYVNGHNAQPVPRADSICLRVFRVGKLFYSHIWPWFNLKCTFKKL